MATFYVYEHWRTDRQECFYVGKGTAGRAYKMRDRNRFHKAICAKVFREGHAVEVKIVAAGLDEGSAFLLEKERIAFWKTACADLANATAGGEGVCGLKMSAEARLKMRVAKLGTKQSPEVVAKRIAPLRGRPQPPSVVEALRKRGLGQRFADSTKQKMSESAKARYLRESPGVECVSDGRQFRTAQEASIFYGFKNHDRIPAACSGKIKHTGGLVFRYVQKEPV